MSTRGNDISKNSLHFAGAVNIDASAAWVTAMGTQRLSLEYNLPEKSLMASCQMETGKKQRNYWMQSENSFQTAVATSEFPLCTARSTHTTRTRGIFNS
jgi:hypothetical protein